MGRNKKAESIKFRPLDQAIKLVESLGKEVSYVYDDLVLVGFSEIILQLPDDGSPMGLYIHRDVAEADRGGIIHSFQTKAVEMELQLYYINSFYIQEKPESREVDIIFEE